ncbi:MAG: hypothetical protein U1F30_04115 [Steroidobacteraceae bacterium]
MTTMIILLAASSAWLWWRLTCANGLNAELRSELAKLRRKVQARG